MRVSRLTILLFLLCAAPLTAQLSPRITLVLTGGGARGLAQVGVLRQLEEAGIKHFVADGNMSILEGSLAMIPRRVLVDSDQLQQARRLVHDAGLEHELRPERGQA